MVAPAAPAETAPAAPAALVPPAPPGAPAVGVPVYLAPVPQGQALVVPDGALAALRDSAYVLIAVPAPLRIDLLVPAAGGGATVQDAPALPAAGTDLGAEAGALLRRAVASASLVADPHAARLATIGPSGRWYAALLTWGWLLLLFAAQNEAQVAGALWLMAGLPLVRRAFRGRLEAWQRLDVDGWQGLGAGPPAVQPLPHAGLSELSAVLQRHPHDPRAACRAAAVACPGAGLDDLAPFYAALARGAEPARVWAQLPDTFAPPAAEPAAEPAPEPAAEPAPEPAAEPAPEPAPAAEVARGAAPAESRSETQEERQDGPL